MRDHYIIILPDDRISPLVRRTPGVRIWQAEDFVKLNADHTANKIYGNRECDIWIVSGESA